MLPSFAPNNTTNILKTYTKKFSKCTLPNPLRSQLSYFYDLFCCQLSHIILFTIAGCSVLQFIGMVIFATIPTKVRQPIMGGVAVLMATFHPRGARTDESEKNKLVPLEIVGLSIFIQTIKRIVLPITAGLKDHWWKAIYITRVLVFPVRPHPTMGAGLIPFKPRDCFPNFVRSVKLIVGHGRTSCKVGLWSEPLSC